jgi:hypothetical protein
MLCLRQMPILNVSMSRVLLNSLPEDVRLTEQLGTNGWLSLTDWAAKLGNERELNLLN